MVMLDGFTVNVKSPVGVDEICRYNCVECWSITRPPFPIPVIVITYDPAGTLIVVDMVTME